MLLEILWAVVLGAIIYLYITKKKEDTLSMGDGWWGRGQKPDSEEDTAIHPFKVEASEAEINDLHRRLDQARFTEPLEDSYFRYGFNHNYLKKVVSYWRNEFNWKKQVEVLNTFPQFKTKIEGFNSVATARVFYKLMLRLGFHEFYAQGGDWGSLITTNVAQIAPRHVKGLHLNMAVNLTLGFKELVSILLGRHFPKLFGFQDEDVQRMFPFKAKVLYKLLMESGYFHLQATKPDTAGCGLNDSPVGMAAYIIEKFSAWTDDSFRNLEDGGLEKKFTLDDLLTNVMLYWVPGCMVSSMRFYKENFGKGIGTQKHEKISVQVPTGIAVFPNDVMHTPLSWLQKKFLNVVSFNFMSRGGHFAAFEEPKILAVDIQQFVDKVEKKHYAK
ncbi:epoxide hydrolase 1 isoform X2 [Tiliqua scincoides]|uniref:epoxide hydrolase 1 isoform X2 n=1 Tax=Tiliqua scincoides TaxID=71010 RepID=UPI003462664E